MNAQEAPSYKHADRLFCPSMASRLCNCPKYKGQSSHLRTAGEGPPILPSRAVTKMGRMTGTSHAHCMPWRPRVSAANPSGKISLHCVLGAQIRDGCTTGCENINRNARTPRRLEHFPSRPGQQYRFGIWSRPSSFGCGIHGPPQAPQTLVDGSGLAPGTNPREPRATRAEPRFVDAAAGADCLEKSFTHYNTRWLRARCAAKQLQAGIVTLTWCLLSVSVRQNERRLTCMCSTQTINGAAAHALAAGDRMRGSSTRADDLIATSPVSKVAALSHLYVNAEVVDVSFRV